MFLRRWEEKGDLHRNYALESGVVMNLVLEHSWVNVVGKSSSPFRPSPFFGGIMRELLEKLIEMW